MRHARADEVLLFASGQRGEAGALAVVIRRLYVSRSLEEIMGVVTYGVRSLLQADGATFVLREGDRCHYAEEDAISPLWKGRRFPIGACISGWCMLNRQPAVVPDALQDPRIPLDAYRPTFVRSLAMAPVGAEAPTAALGAYWSKPREIPPEELELLQVLANATALALAGVETQPATRAQAAPPPRRAPEMSAPPAGGLRRRLAAAAARLTRQGLRPNSPAAYLFAMLCVVLSTLVRWAVNAEIGPLNPFSTYYPATLLTVLFAGVEAGILAGLLGGLVACWAFIPPDFNLNPLTAANVFSLALYAGVTALMIWMLERHRRAVRRLMEEDAWLVTVTREQHHRMQNAIAVVETIVRQSLKRDPAQAQAINHRIRAGLGDLDIRPRAGAPKSIRAVLKDELQPFDLARFELEGADEALVEPDLGRLLALAAHELATNALKYGALATPQGRVAIDWSVGDGRAVVCWREHGGPPVQPPAQRGYGTILLHRLVEARKGAVALDFRPAGLVAELSLPLRAPRG